MIEKERKKEARKPPSMLELVPDKLKPQETKTVPALKIPQIRSDKKMMDEVKALPRQQEQAEKPEEGFWASLKRIGVVIAKTASIVLSFFKTAASPIVSGFVFIYDAAKAAEKSAAEKTPFVKELWNSVNPISKAKDAFDSVFPAPKPDHPEINSAEYAERLKEISWHEKSGRLNTAKRKLETLMQCDLSPTQKAELEVKFDSLDAKLANEGLPFSINIFRPSSFLRSKKSVHEEKLAAKLDEKGRRLTELVLRPSITKEEKEELAYLYEYLRMKDALPTKTQEAKSKYEESLS